MGKLRVFLGRIFAVVVVASMPAFIGNDIAIAASASRVSAFQYNAANGLLTGEIVEPDDNTYKVTTTYALDAFGNRTAATVSGNGSANRTATVVYGADGRFALQQRNPLNQTITQAYDTRFGTVTSATDPNGISGSVQYDGFGRKVLEIGADGTGVKYEYQYCDSYGGSNPEVACPLSLARHVVIVTPVAQNGTTAIGPWTRTYLDALNREIRVQTQGFDSTIATVDTEYDSLGRVARKSEPYVSGETVYWTASTYDSLDRPLVVTAPHGGQTVMAYTGLTAKVTNAKGQVSIQVKNSQGAVVSTRDAQNSLLRFEYDPFGNLVQTIDPAGNRVKAAYDRRGRRTQLIDPDLGTRNFFYNAIGPAYQDVDAKGQTTTYTYDLLDRMTGRQEVGLTTTWIYDTATKGIGKPASVTTSTNVTRTFSYDSLGRPAGMVENHGSGIATTTSQSYDTYGRVSSEVLPGGQTISYVYNALGYLSEIRNGATSGLIWRAEARDATGSLTQERYGNNITTRFTRSRAWGDLVTGIKSRTASSGTDNIQNLGYTYDLLFNMTQRQDTIQGTVEAFGFDALNRLTASQVTGYAAQTVTYDALGNITAKSDVGTYTYGLAGGARPHAVTAIAGGAVTTSFTYDANGNMLTGHGRTMTWTSYDMPATIQKGGTTLSFVYGPGHERVKQTKPGEIIHYFGSSELVQNTATGVSTWTNYIAAEGRLVAQISREATAAPNLSVARYFHPDHLGSIDVVTDEFARVVERPTFDAWGKRRNLNGASDTAAGTITSTIRRGFTGHEQLDGVGLVHMNGRVYDPLVARFLSADLFVQAPLNLQSFNRYTYVLNNPLSFVDPDGFMFVDNAFGKNASRVGGSGASVGGANGAPNGKTMSGGPSSSSGRGGSVDIKGPKGGAEVQGVGRTPSRVNRNSQSASSITGRGAAPPTPSRKPSRKEGAPSSSSSAPDSPSDLDNEKFEAPNVGARSLDGPPDKMGGGRDASPNAIGGGVLAGSVGTMTAPPMMVPFGVILSNPHILLGLLLLSLSADTPQKKSYLVHYTDEIGLAGILGSQSINPSLRSLNPNDARYGDGQYFTDIVPGEMGANQLSRALVGNPWQGNRFTHFVVIDVTDLNIVLGRPRVYVVPNQIPLNVSGKIVNWGRN